MTDIEELRRALIRVLRRNLTQSEALEVARKGFAAVERKRRAVR